MGLAGRGCSPTACSTLQPPAVCAPNLTARATAHLLQPCLGWLLAPRPRLHADSALKALLSHLAAEGVRGCGITVVAHAYQLIPQLAGFLQVRSPVVQLVCPLGFSALGFLDSVFGGGGRGGYRPPPFLSLCGLWVLGHPHTPDEWLCLQRLSECSGCLHFPLSAQDAGRILQAHICFIAVQPAEEHAPPQQQPTQQPQAASNQAAFVSLVSQFENATFYEHATGAASS